MATPISPIPDLSQYNFAIGDTEKVVTKQNGVNAEIDALVPRINTAIGEINQDAEAVNQAAQNLDVDAIVHAPGSGLPNEAGEAYRRSVAGGSANAPLMAEGYGGLGGPAEVTGDVFGSTSFNDYTKPGVYTTTGDYTDGPLSGGGSATHTGLLTVKQRAVGDNNAYQEWDSTFNQKFYRPDVDELWTPVFTGRNSVGITSSESGLATGSIFEVGGNSDGRYQITLDGMMTCWGSLDLGSILANGSGTFQDPYTTKGGVISYPRSFLETPSFSIEFISSPLASSSDRALVPGYAQTTNSLINAIRAYRVSGGNSDVNITAIWMAKGRRFTL